MVERMKPLRLLPTLILFLLGIVGPSRATQAESSNFLSPLRYTGSQWQVKSTLGPISLARLEGGTWRVLACFDGTKGKYFLDWEQPNHGVYAALDSLGGFSESVKISDGRERGRQ